MWLGDRCDLTGRAYSTCKVVAALVARMPLETDVPDQYLLHFGSDPGPLVVVPLVDLMVWGQADVDEGLAW